MPSEQNQYRRLYTAIKILFGIVIAMLLLGRPPVYFAKSINSVVIDSKTNQPIQGVNVVAIWIAESGFIGGSYNNGIINVEEAITDEEGRFSIGWWGPRIPLSGRLTVNAPELILFGTNYRSMVLGNSIASRKPLSPWQTSDWNNKKISMDKINSIEERVNSARYSSDTLDILFMYSGCYWENAQNAWLAIIREGETLQKLGADTTGIMNKENFERRVLCGDPQKLFGA